MCGFVAVYNRNHVPVSPTMLQKMIDVIAHRGPDDEGIHVDGRIGLGFRRLSIVDLENGAQPMSNQAGDVWIVFNGEIYNCEELKKWLEAKGQVFYTRSDTEVILRLYEEVGKECPQYLRGMFGFTIWDKKRDLIFAARDPFGVKPVYYSQTSSGYMLGSEIKAFFASDTLDREVDEEALFHYFTFQYVPEPHTMFKSISKLKAGHSVLIQDDQITVVPYYEAKFNPDPSRSFSDLAEEAHAVLTESVALHRNADVPVGAFLSGGIDSSSLVGLLHRQQPVKTFSVGFGMPGYCELGEAKKTAAYLGTEHHEIRVSPKDYMDVLPALIWHMDEPVADPSAVGLYFVSKLAREHVKVVFSGEGADEFFGGYNIYKEPHSLRMFRHFPDGLLKMTGYVAELLPSGMKGKSFLERGSLRLEHRFVGNAKIFADDEKEKAFAEEFIRKGLYRPSGAVTAPLYEKARNYDDVTKMQYIDIHTWLRGNILMKADKMSMANSLELRVPFIDTKVFQFAAAIPTKFRVTPNATKVLLREAMKDVVPPDVQTRKKWGFPVPTRVWLRDEWHQWARDLIHTANVGQWIDKPYALQLLEMHRQGKLDASRKLWAVLIFILWHQIYIEEASGCPGRPK